MITRTLIPILINSCILGALSGLLWAYCLGNMLKSGAITGVIVGGILSFTFVSLTGRNKAQGFTHKESIRGTAGVMMAIFIASIIIALLVGLVRWIF